MVCVTLSHSDLISFFLNTLDVGMCPFVYFPVDSHCSCAHTHIFLVFLQSMPACVDVCVCLIFTLRIAVHEKDPK